MTTEGTWGSLGLGKPKFTVHTWGFFQELAPLDGTGYMDVGKVAFTFYAFQEELSSCLSFLCGEGVGGKMKIGKQDARTVTLPLNPFRFVPEGPRGRCPGSPGRRSAQVRKLGAPDLHVPCLPAGWVISLHRAGMLLEN